MTDTTGAYALHVNGAEHQVLDSWAGESLLFVLRDRLGLPGAKAGCDQGECGSCSVFLDGNLVCSCLVMAAAAVGTEIVSVEGIQPPERGALTDVQRAFVETGAIQCGFCTPGLVMAVHDLLAREAEPDDLTVREALAGNLCRCTGYGRIFEAVHAVVAERRGSSAVGEP